MKPPISWAARLYPAPWRARYGAEFSTLLDDMRPGWRDFFDILRGSILMQLKFPVNGKIVAALAAAGLIVATVVAFRTEDHWVSTAVMQLQPQTSGDRWTALNRLNEVQQELLSRTFLSHIIVDEDIYKKERATDPLEDIVQNMRSHTTIRVVGPANDQNAVTAFSVSFEYPDRYKAQAVTHDVTAAFEQQVGKGSGPTLKLLDPASLPQEPVGPNRAFMIAAGLAIGLAAGVIVLGIRRWPVVAACGAGAALLVWAGSLLFPNQYLSIAVLTVPDQDTAQRISQDLTTRTYLASLIEKMHLYPQERKTKPLEAIVETMRNRAIRIHAVGNNPARPAIAISYMSEDSKFTAQAVTRALAGEAIEANLRAQSHGVTIVLDPPSLPAKPVAPNRAAWTLLGLVAGLLLGTAWAATRRFRTAATAHA